MQGRRGFLAKMMKNLFLKGVRCDFFASGERMNCPKCGQELSDRSVFCPNCGTAILKQQAAPAETSAETPVVTEAAAEAAVAETPVVEAAAEPAVAEVPKKKTFWQRFRLPICIGAPVIALVLVFALNFNWFVGFFLKTFAKPDAYYSHVEQATFTDLTENVSKIYGSLFGTGEQKEKETYIAAKGKVKLSLGDKAVSLLSEAVGTDLSWLSEVSYGVDMKSSGNNLISLTVDLGLAGGQVIEANLIFDVENMKGYVAVPDLNPTYVSFDLSALFGGGSVMDYQAAANLSDGYYGASEEVAVPSSGMSSYYELYSKILKDAPEILPTEEEFNKLLDRYVKVALGAIKDVEKGSEKLSVGDLDMNVTTLEVEFSEETLLDVLVAVLEEAKEDDDLKGYVEKIEKYVEKEFANGEDLGLAKGMKEGIKMMLSSLKDVDASSETVLTMTTFVNGSHEIVGREFKAGKQDILSYAKINKGSKFAFELEVSGQKIMEGSGKESGGKMTGSFEIGAMGQKFVEIELEEFDWDGLKEDGLLNGKIKISLGEALLEQLNLPAILTNPSLELSFTSEEGKTKAEMKLMTGSEKLAAIEISAEGYNGGSVKIPSDAVDSMDEDAVMSWWKALDYEKALNNLKSAGVPSDLVDSLKEELEDAMG